MIHFVFITICLLLFACGARPSTSPQDPQINMEAVIIKPPDASGHLDFYSAKDLFNRGRLARAFDKYPDCIRFFNMVLNDFPKSRYAVPALYNRGLCHESAAEPNAAIESFERYVQLSDDPEDQMDGFFRLLHNLIEAERNSRALVLSQRLLESELSDIDRAEVLTKQGAALYGLANHDQSKTVFFKAVRLAKKATDGLVHKNAVLAEAEYRIGLLFAAKMRSQRLALPLKHMKRSLNEKMAAFRKSQHHLLNAVKGQIKSTSTMAGQALGTLYADLYAGLLAAERPANLSAEEVTIYLEELIKRVTPVLRHAITIYEKSLSLGKRLGAQESWLTEVTLQKERLESLLKEADDAFVE